MLSIEPWWRERSGRLRNLLDHHTRANQEQEKEQEQQQQQQQQLLLLLLLLLLLRLHSTQQELGKPLLKSKASPRWGVRWEAPALGAVAWRGGGRHYAVVFPFFTGNETGILLTTWATLRYFVDEKSNRPDCFFWYVVCSWMSVLCQDSFLGNHFSEDSTLHILCCLKGHQFRCCLLPPSPPYVPIYSAAVDRLPNFHAAIMCYTTSLAKARLTNSGFDVQELLSVGASSFPKSCYCALLN